MPQLNHTGPDGKGPKSGRKLGACKKTEKEKQEMGTMGIGESRRRHSGGGIGKGKRIKYNQYNRKVIYESCSTGK